MIRPLLGMSGAMVGLALMLGASQAQASDGSEMVGALRDVCMVSLETRTAVGPGVTRAPAEMEAKLLNGKIASVWRTANPKIVVVAHDSGNTCEVMGLGMVVSDFAEALRLWAADAGMVIDADENMNDDGPGGAYLARAMAEGDFVQIYIEAQPAQTFVGVTATRVQDSVQAKELLGME